MRRLDALRLTGELTRGCGCERIRGSVAAGERPFGGETNQLARPAMQAPGQPTRELRLEVTIPPAGHAVVRPADVVVEHVASPLSRGAESGDTERALAPTPHGPPLAASKTFEGEGVRVGAGAGRFELRRKVFATLDGSADTTLSSRLALAVCALILVSVVNFVVASLPKLRESPVCAGIEAVCIVGFTVRAGPGRSTHPCFPRQSV